MENEISFATYFVPCQAQSKGIVQDNALLVVAMVAVIVKKENPQAENPQNHLKLMGKCIAFK